MKNRVVHFEIHAKDQNALQKFYVDVFGWDFKDMGPVMGNYRLITTGADREKEAWPGINGGMMIRQGELPVEGSAVNAFVCTIEVENIDAAIEKVKIAGGHIALEKMNVPGVGDLAYAKDIDGNIFGILQPATTSP